MNPGRRVRCRPLGLGLVIATTPPAACLNARMDRQSFIKFVAIAFGLTWIVQFGLVAAGIPPLSPVAIPAMLLAAVAPSLAAVIVTARSSGGVRAALRQLWGPPGGPIGWLALALVARKALVVAAAIIVVALGGDAPEVALIPMTIGTALVASFGEELGWRGFAYRRLARVGSPALAALATSALWALWHLPTAWFGEPSAVEFGLYAVQVTAFGVVICWLFERSGGRTLTAVLAHVGVNLGILHLPDTALASGVTLALTVAAGLAAGFALGTRNTATDSAAESSA